MILGNRPASVEKSSFGKLPDGSDVSLFTLNTGVVRVRLSDYGGIITGIETPDRKGVPGDIALGFDRLEDYLADTAYHGAICGRTCNRIAHGRFTLDGREYRLAVNNGPNNNHGGVVGFNRAQWSAETGVTPEGAFVRLYHLSPDGDEGYPGNLSVEVTYTLKNSGVFRMEFCATTDAPTPVNLTNHTYFNLAGHAAGDFSGHILQANSSCYLPADADGLVTGEVISVEGTPFDFRRPRPMGDPMEPHGVPTEKGKNSTLRAWD